MPGRYENRCRRLLRAYPPRYRFAREDELISTLLEAAEPGRAVPSLRDCWDIVRGGLLTRWRDHPPPLPWLLYRLFGRRLPNRWQAWVRDEVRGRGFMLRNLLIPLAVQVPILLSTAVILTAAGAGSAARGILIGAVSSFTLISLINLLHIDRGRREVLKKHGLGPDGLPLPPGEPWLTDGWPLVRVPARRQQVWPLLLAFSSALLVAAAGVAPPALLFPPTDQPATGVFSGQGYGGPALLGVCGGAVVLSVLLSLLAAARLRRRLARRDLQPGQQNVVMPPIATVAALPAGFIAFAGTAVVAPLTLLAAGVIAGPFLIIVGCLSRAEEHRTGAFVTMTEIVWALFCLPDTPPPAGTRLVAPPPPPAAGFF